MLILFRRLRGGFLGSGQGRRYLLYAIGEILLVMIGILLALQVNNWNESRKSRKLEREYLSEIRDNMQIDLEALQVIVDHHEKNLVNISWCIEHLDNSDFDRTKFVEHYNAFYSGYPTFFPRDGGYTSLMSSGGLSLISGKKLSSSIVDLYEHYYERLIYNGEFLDGRLTKFQEASGEYYLIAQGKFFVEDIQATDILVDLNFIARTQRAYVGRARETRDVLIKVLDQLTEELER